MMNIFNNVAERYVNNEKYTWTETIDLGSVYAKTINDAIICFMYQDDNLPQVLYETDSGWIELEVEFSEN